MLAFARVWQHTLRPGEILLMPWGTFHAVRNLTATLSYHRFHLDRINLPAFYRSMVDCDAPGSLPTYVLSSFLFNGDGKPREVANNPLAGVDT